MPITTTLPPISAAPKATRQKHRTSTRASTASTTPPAISIILDLRDLGVVGGAVWQHDQPQVRLYHFQAAQPIHRLLARVGKLVVQFEHLAAHRAPRDP